MLKLILHCQSSTESTALQNRRLQTSKRSTETPVARLDGWGGGGGSKSFVVPSKKFQQADCELMSKNSSKQYCELMDAPGVHSYQ